jgi:hypothetical protein
MIPGDWFRPTTASDLHTRPLSWNWSDWEIRLRQSSNSEQRPAPQRHLSALFLIVLVNNLTMNAAGSNLVAHVLHEYFGPTAELVGRAMIKSDKLPLRLIAHQSGVSLAKVKRILLVFHQHQLLHVLVHPVRSFVEYQLIPEAVIRMLRYPRYVVAVKNVYV